METLGIGLSNSLTEAEVTVNELVVTLTKKLAEAEGSLGWWTSKKETGNYAMGDVDAEIQRAKAQVESYKASLEVIFKSIKNL